MKHFTFVAIFAFSTSVLAAQYKCIDLFEKSKRELQAAAKKNQQIRGFADSPEVLDEVNQIVSQSRFRPEVDQIEGFNSDIIQEAPRIEKLVRQETPFTVSLMGREVIQEISEIGEFAQIGIVYGDPHFGNSNSQPNVFRGKKVDRNRYGLVDVDEVAVGVFSLDLARYSIFLKASFGDLNRSFGEGFEKELFENYQRGLQQDRSVKVPEFIKEALNATSEEIRAKVDDYALDRTDDDGYFKKKLFDKGEFLEFSTKNMKPGFLEKMGFDRKTEDRKDFKKKIYAMMVKAAQMEMGDNVKVLDIAIPFRDSGGSADLQRFLLSTEVTFEGEVYRMILEFKENVEMAAWNAVIETPSMSAADRYRLALKVSTDDGGPFLQVVEFSRDVSFLMRPKGNLDIEYDTKSEVRELALYNAYTMGLFHGGQQTASAQQYVQAVSANLTKFQTTVTQVAEKILKKLLDTSGLKLPKQK